MMNYRKFLIPVLVTVLAGTVFAQNTVTKSFTVNGTTHNCLWHVPSEIDKPPVVFFIHGANGSGSEFENTTKGDPVADKEKFIAVYPSASSGGGAGIWADMSGTSNFPFFLAVLDTLDNRYQIDRDRVYMTGFSQGGFVSFVAGCKYSDIFAAIAPVSGHAGSSCTLTRPVSVYLTFGANEDKTSFINDLNIWLKLDSCPSTPTITRPYPLNTQSKVTRVSYGPCAQGTYVIMDSISGQGHQWPSASNLNQAEDTWEFFKQFSLDNSTGIHKQTHYAAREPVSASYTSGIIRFRGVGEKAHVRVVDTRGRLAASAVMTGNRFSFINKPGGVYLITVRGNNRSAIRKIIVP